MFVTPRDGMRVLDRGTVRNFVREAIRWNGKDPSYGFAGRDPQELFAKDGLIDELKKALSERMLAAELTIIWQTKAPKVQ